MVSPGAFIAVVGPSGVGKDSVLYGAKKRLADECGFVYPRRFITRPADAGGEPHRSLTRAEFIELRVNGAFCIWWEAHHLLYGLPRDLIDTIATGTHVIANLSRNKVAELATIFPRSYAVEITARAETVKNRLAARGRETELQIEARSSRNVSSNWAGAVPVHQLSNDGSLGEAIGAFTELAISLANETARSGETV